MQTLQACPCVVTFPKRAGLGQKLGWWGLYSGAGEAVCVKCSWSGWQLDERAVEVWLRTCAQHGHWGLHLRNAAWWRTMGIHPKRGRGGHLQTLHCFPGIYLFSSLSWIVTKPFVLLLRCCNFPVWVTWYKVLAEVGYEALWEKIKKWLFWTVRVAAFLCALAVFWWEIPRHPYMVKAKGECEAGGSVI